MNEQLYICNKANECGYKRCQHQKPHKLQCDWCECDFDECVCEGGEDETCILPEPCPQVNDNDVHCIPYYIEFITEEEMKL